MMKSTDDENGCPNAGRAPHNGDLPPCADASKCAWRAACWHAAQQPPTLPKDQQDALNRYEAALPSLAAPIGYVRKDFKDRLDRYGITDLSEHPDKEGSSVWDVPVYTAPPSATRTIDATMRSLAKRVIDLHELNRDGASGRAKPNEVKLAEALLAATDGRAERP